MCTTKATFNPLLLILLWKIKPDIYGKHHGEHFKRTMSHWIFMPWQPFSKMAAIRQWWAPNAMDKVHFQFINGDIFGIWHLSLLVNTIGDIFTKISGILHLSTVLAIFQDGRRQAIFADVWITSQFQSFVDHITPIYIYIYDIQYRWLENSFIIRKGTESKGGQQSWLKNLAQFHINWYAIHNAVLTLLEETVFKYIAHGKWQKAKIRFIHFVVSISKLNLKKNPMNGCFKAINLTKLKTKRV